MTSKRKLAIVSGFMLLAIILIIFIFPQLKITKENAEIRNHVVSAISNDSIFKQIDSQVYLFKNYAFCNMLSFGNKGAKYKDLSSSLLYEYLPSETDIVRIREFNKNILDRNRLSPNKRYQDTISVPIFALGFELYKSGRYDSLALECLKDIYSPSIIKSYKMADRSVSSHSFPWIFPDI